MSRPPQLRLNAGAPVLVVMARPLVRGAVKTRLAETIGDDEALALYTDLLRGTLTQAERLEDIALVLAETGEGASVHTHLDRRATGATAPSPDILAGRPGTWQRLAQSGETLGERLANVFSDAFAAGAGSVVAVDSDSPAIPLEYLEGAFAAAGDTAAAGTVATDGAAPAPPDGTPGRLVVGPAADGGYYLIGLGRDSWRRSGDDIRGLLASSPMSTASLLAYTERAARALRAPHRPPPSLGRRRRAGRPRLTRASRRERPATRRASRAAA